MSRCSGFWFVPCSGLPWYCRVAVGMRDATMCCARCAAGDLRARVRATSRPTRRQIVGELLELLAIPNVAADKREHPAQRRTPARRCSTRHGLTAEILETAGNPLVYGALNVPGATRDDPVLLPLRRPAGGSRRSGTSRIRSSRSCAAKGADARIYARSASDDKAPIVALLAALDALEGGGPRRRRPTSASSSTVRKRPARRAWCRRSRATSDKLRADLMVILDGPGHSSGRPTVATARAGSPRST